ncbi:MAG: peptidase M23, partial [Desulfocurvibacter africanus]
MSDQLFPGMMNEVQDQTELSNYAKLVAQSQALRRRFESPNQDKAKLREATQDFEAIFIGKLWEQMRNTVPKEGYLHSKQE